MKEHALHISSCETWLWCFSFNPAGLVLNSLHSTFPVLCHRDIRHFHVIPCNRNSLDNQKFRVFKLKTCQVSVLTSSKNALQYYLQFWLLGECFHFPYYITKQLEKCRFCSSSLHYDFNPRPLSPIFFFSPQHLFCVYLVCASAHM